MILLPDAKFFFGFPTKEFEPALYRNTVYELALGAFLKLTFTEVLDNATAEILVGALNWIFFDAADALGACVANPVIAIKRARTNANIRLGRLAYPIEIA